MRLTHGPAGTWPHPCRARAMPFPGLTPEAASLQSGATLLWMAASSPSTASESFTETVSESFGVSWAPHLKEASRLLILGWSRAAREGFLSSPARATQQDSPSRESRGRILECTRPRPRFLPSPPKCMAGDPTPAQLSPWTSARPASSMLGTPLPFHGKSGSWSVQRAFEGRMGWDGMLGKQKPSPALLWWTLSPRRCDKLT